jgi:hypothetical protein
MTRHPGSRGSALLFTLIALIVLTLLVLGAIEFTGRNREGAVAKGRGDRLEACAETARRYLLSRLRVFDAKVPVQQLVLDEVLLDEVKTSERTRIRTGHYGGASAEAVVARLPAGAVGDSIRQVRDVANTLPDSTTLGGSYYRVVMTCQEPGGHEVETEFVFRFGL